jgi:hypothetical protein
MWVGRGGGADRCVHLPCKVRFCVGNHARQTVTLTNQRANKMNNRMNIMQFLTLNKQQHNYGIINSSERFVAQYIAKRQESFPPNPPP